MPALEPYLIEPIWEQFEALLPERRTDHPLGCHRPRIPDRVVFGKLVEVLVFGCAYDRIADESCSESMLRRRRDEWIEAGLMERLRGISLEAYDRLIGLELADLAVDGCITKTPRGGEKAGRSPVDRGKRGLKRSTAVDANGIPLGTVTAPANRHDSPLLGETLDAVGETLGGCPSGRGSTRTAATTRPPSASGWRSAGCSPRSPGRASRPRCRPRSAGSWNGPTRGATPTRSWCGARSARGGSSTSGWPSPTWSSL